MSRLIRILVAGLSAFLLTSATVQAGEAAPGAKRLVTISGMELTENAWTSYTQVIYAPDGNLASPGLLLRGFFLNGKYDYDAAVPSGEIDVDLLQGDLMIGYGGIFNQLWLAAYVGVDYQDHDLDFADPTNSVNGDETGFKVVGEALTIGRSDIFASVYGSYSTAFDSYYARLRIAPVLLERSFLIGLELTALGDDEWDAKRVGSFLKMPLDLGLGPLIRGGELTVSGGYQFADDDSMMNVRADSSEGGYGTVQYKVLY